MSFPRRFKAGTRIHTRTLLYAEKTYYAQKRQTHPPTHIYTDTHTHTHNLDIRDEAKAGDDSSEN